MRQVVGILSLSAALSGCGPASAPPPVPTDEAQGGTRPLTHEALSPPEGPGPMPKQPTRNEALAAAPGSRLDDEEALRAWLEARVDAARAGITEGVRVPIFVRLDADTCACPRFMLGGGPDAEPALPVAVLDLTSAGTPTYARPGTLLWVEGRFVTASKLAGPPAPDEGSSGPAHTLEILRAEARPADAEPLFRFAR